jgi:hypothetical protein
MYCINKAGFCFNILLNGLQKVNGLSKTWAAELVSLVKLPVKTTVFKVNLDIILIILYVLCFLNFKIPFQIVKLYTSVHSFRPVLSMKKLSEF